MFETFITKPFNNNSRIILRDGYIYSHYSINTPFNNIPIFNLISTGYSGDTNIFVLSTIKLV